MVYTNQAIKISISETSFFSLHFLQPWRKFQLLLNFRVWGRLNFNSELLPTRCSDFILNLSKVTIDDTCYVSVSAVGVFVLFIFRF